MKFNVIRAAAVSAFVIVSVAAFAPRAHAFEMPDECGGAVAAGKSREFVDWCLDLAAHISDPSYVPMPFMGSEWPKPKTKEQLREEAANRRIQEQRYRYFQQREELIQRCRDLGFRCF